MVTTSGVGGVGVICVCGSSMDAKMTESVDYDFVRRKRNAAEIRISIEEEEKNAPKRRVSKFVP